MVHTINTREHFFDAITLMKITHNCIFPELANKKKSPKCVCTETTFDFVDILKE